MLRKERPWKVERICLDMFRFCVYFIYLYIMMVVVAVVNSYQDFHARRQGMKWDESDDLIRTMFVR